MDSRFGEMDRNGEELTGRKKSRFKQLKTRLFGKLKKKERVGLMKPSQSASDITAPGGRRESYDSEDEGLFPQCLSSRALSHESIFLTDQTQSTEPTRVLSQENVHGKIKALQLKLHQQNLRVGPPPVLIPGRRTEDSGATSEDDGLPCSPLEMSFHEQVIHGAVYKYPESQKHLSSLSLAGTGSEEEEQADPFQPSSRPLSPVSKPPSQPTICPALTTPTTGVDFDSPVHCMPRLDNSAARHRMSVKPRNQRVSTRGKRAPMVSLSPRHRSESFNDLDNIMSEEDDDDETTMTSETTPHRLYSSPTPKLRERPASPEPKAIIPVLSVQSQEETPTEIKLSSTDAEILKSKSESVEPEGRVTINPLYMQPISTGLSSGRTSPSGRPESTSTSRETEPFWFNSPIQRHPDTQKIQISDCKGFRGSNENLSWERGGIHPEASSRLHPVPHIKKPQMEMRNLPSPTGATEASAKPWEAGLKPSTPELSPTAACTGVDGSPSGQDTKSQTLNSASFQFSIASARYRSKAPGETVVKQNEGNLKGSPGIKTQSSKPNAEPQKDEAREIKPTELQKHLSHQIQETKSSSPKDVTSPIMPNPTTGNHLKKTEMSVEHVETEKDEEPEDRKNAFGVQLRTTSLSLKYRSEVSKMKDETKRYSLESNQMKSEEHASKAETPTNMCDGKPNVPKKQDSQNLDSQCATTDNRRPSTHDTTATSKEAGSEPDWMSLAREKTRAYQPLLSKLSTNQSPQVHPPPPAVPPLQPPKPTSLLKTQPITTTLLPMKTQHTVNTQTTTQQSSHLTTQRSPSKLNPNGNREKPVSPGWRSENPFSQLAGGGRLADSKDKGTPAVRNNTSETAPSKEVNNRQESITPTSTEAPPITSEPSSSSSSEVSHQQQPRSDGAEPSWMELAKKKSLAWSDKT